MKRILLLVLTNVLIVVVLGIVASLLGVNRYLTSNGLNLGLLLGYALVIGFGGAFISLLISKPMAKWSSGVQVIAQPQNADEAWIVETVRKFADKAGIGMPEVGIFEGEPNAFATGRNPNHAAITVTTGLLAVMSRRELRGVLAHEMSHIRNRDIAVTTLAVLAVGAIAVIAQVALRIGIFGGMRRGGRNNDGMAIFLVLSLAIYLLAVPAGLLLKASLSRKRESLADATAVELTREPAGLRSALEKLEADTTVIAHPSAATAHLWIESPLERGHDEGMLGSFGRMMDTHPPLAERIAKLRVIEGLDPDGRGPNDPYPTAI